MSDQPARFPEDISYGSVGGPVFSTSISELKTGKEQRKVNWSRARNKYNVVYGVKSSAQFSVLVSFFYAHKGRAIPFRFKDWSDYKTEGEIIDVGDGKQSVFQLVKHYTTATYSYKRPISKPVPGTVIVYLEERQERHKTECQINHDTGQVTFSQSPPPGTLILADFEFDVLVRFDTDFLACALDGYGNYGCNNIPLVEVQDP